MHARSRTLLPIAVAIALIFTLASPQTALASSSSGSWFQGFERNTSGWFSVSGGTIYRVPSYYVSSGYASGIPSSSGRYHARLGKDPNPDTCVFGGGTALIYRGPSTDFGGPRATFPTGGYQTDLDIYLDVTWAQSHPDSRFDWDSANNVRDYIFNAGTDPLGFVISASNNGDRCSSFPANPGRAPQHVTVSGWYTFEHVFTAGPGGLITVAMRIIQRSTGQTVASWTLVGGETTAQGGGWQYGWFVQNEIPELAVDNTFRSVLCRQGDGDGDFEDRDGHKHHAKFHGDGCDNGSGDVEDDDDDGGHHFHSSSVTATTFATDEDGQTMTIVGTGLDDGVPVGFTFTAIDFNGLIPATYTLTLTDGRVVIGTLTSGAVAID